MSRDAYRHGEDHHAPEPHNIVSARTSGMWQAGLLHSHGPRDGEGQQIDRTLFFASLNSLRRFFVVLRMTGDERRVTGESAAYSQVVPRLLLLFQVLAELRTLQAFREQHAGKASQILALGLSSRKNMCIHPRASSGIYTPLGPPLLPA